MKKEYYEIRIFNDNGRTQNTFVFDDLPKAIKCYNEIETINKECLQKIIDINTFIQSLYYKKQTINEEDIFYTLESENNVRENLFLGIDFEDFWEENKKNIMHTLGKYQKFLEQENYGYCLENDWQEEKDFMQDCDTKIKKIFNDNGIIIYQKMKKRG